MKATTLGSVVEPSKCRLLLVFQGFASQLLTMGVQFILSLRGAFALFRPAYIKF